MTRASQFILAALFAAILGISGLTPVRAATMPAGAAITLDQASKPQADQAQYRRRGGYYRGGGYYRPRAVYRRPYYRPIRVYRAPVYYRRCVTRPRVVWTPYGYVRRWVRVCR